MSDPARIRLVSPATADLFRISDNIASAFRSSLGESILQSTGAIQRAVEQQQIMIQDSVMAMQRAGNDVAAALASQQAELARAVNALSPALTHAEHVRTQMRALTLQVPDPQVAAAITRSAQQAITRLADADKVRVRNALVHMKGVNDQIRRDQLGLAMATIHSWRTEGARQLREVADLFDFALNRWVLEPVVDSLCRSPSLFIASSPRPLLCPRFNGRLVGWLRDLTCSISPHAPPACVA